MGYLNIKRVKKVSIRGMDFILYSTDNGMLGGPQRDAASTGVNGCGINNGDSVEFHMDDNGFTLLGITAQACNSCLFKPETKNQEGRCKFYKI